MDEFLRNGWMASLDEWMAPLARDGGNLTQWEMVFDERVKFLGSLVEMGIYRVSGILINDYGWAIRFAKDGKRDGWMNRMNE